MEGILEELVKTATVEEERTEAALFASNAVTIIDGQKRVALSSNYDNSKEDWLLGRRQVAKNCKEKCRWFRTRINFSKNAEWNVKTIWQKDIAKQFLSVPQVAPK